MLDDKYIERITEADQRSKSNTKRLDEVEKEIKEIRDLTISVKEIATEMKHMREEQTNMNERLKVIEEKPLKEYEDTKKQIRNYVLVFILGVVLSFIAVKLGLGQYL